ncbi:MAG: deoxyhypusine synthase [Thermoprotei archaeon]|nr:deoxyhypusine synthase [Thermoprotei archaeon]
MGLEPVRDVRVRVDMGVCELIELYRNIHGFSASSLGEALDILSEGLAASDVRILSFTGNLVATGLRGVLAQLAGSGLFNVVFTTTGAVDHDIARAVGGVYFKGSFDVDDVELKRRGFQRLGNIFIPVDSYGPLIEKFTRELVERALKVKDRWGSYELLKMAGEMLRDENSILWNAYRSGCEVFVPGWPDGSWGTSLFMESQRLGGLTVDYFIDMKRLSDIFFTSRKAAALIVGGGISKHHTIWWAQFKEGLDYTVYITTALEYDGSLSGARPREAVSWGKIKAGSMYTVVYGDATIILPIIASCILSKLKRNVYI